jgi:hypothetical protein
MTFDSTELFDTGVEVGQSIVTGEFSRLGFEDRVKGAGEVSDSSGVSIGEALEIEPQSTEEIDSLSVRRHARFVCNVIDQQTEHLVRI